MKMRFINLVPFFAWFLIISCGGSSNSPSGPEVNSGQGVDYNISGKVQKGPYILWSDITIQELNKNLEPNGNVYLTRTIDDKGQFNIETKIKSRFVEIIGNGYYFDEVSGDLSASTLSLRTISDLSEGSNINVNILTTLTCDRIKNLIGEGMSFSDAVLQARMEILAEFNIPDLSDKNGTVYFDKLDISNSGESNAVLLAISCVIQQVATNRASSYSTVTSELSELLPRMAMDFGEDGQVDDDNLKDEIKTGGMTVNLSKVRSNLEDRYSDLGEKIDAPTFEAYIDSDGDTIINGNEDDTPEPFSFDSISEVEINTIQLSNVITINEIKEWGFTLVSVNNGTIIKNGIELSGNSTTVVNGDTLQLKLESSTGFGEISNTDLTVGTETQSFSVSTRIPKLLYVQGYGYSAWGPADESSVYFAMPIYPTESFNAKYIGIGILGTPDFISIYTDNGDKPGTPVSSSTTVDTYFVESFEDLDGNIYDNHPQNQAYLGINGVNLIGNTKYWVVVKYPLSTEPMLFGLYDEVPFSERKKSTDGIIWTTWNGASNGRYSNNTVKVFLSN